MTDTTQVLATVGEKREQAVPAVLAFAREIERHHRAGVAHGSLSDRVRVGDGFVLSVDSWPEPTSKQPFSPWQVREPAGAADDVRALDDIATLVLAGHAAKACPIDPQQCPKCHHGTTEYQALAAALVKSRATHGTTAATRLEHIITPLDALCRTAKCAMCGMTQRLAGMTLAGRGPICAACSKSVAATPGGEMDLAFDEREQDQLLTTHRNAFWGALGAFVLLAVLIPIFPARAFILLAIGSFLTAVFELGEWRLFVKRRELRERYKRGEISKAEWKPPTAEEAAAELRRHTVRRRRMIAVAVAVPLLVLLVLQLAG